MYNQEGVPFVALDEFGGSHGVGGGCFWWLVIGELVGEKEKRLRSRVIFAGK